MEPKLLQKIENELVTRREKLTEELKQLAEKDESGGDSFSSKFPQYGDDLDENAEEVAVNEQNQAVVETLEDSLRDIDGALKRIKQGTYGICKYCGKLIDEKRLIARPVSSACMSCKSKMLKK